MFFFITGHCKALNIVPCARQQNLLLIYVWAFISRRSEYRVFGLRALDPAHLSRCLTPGVRAECPFRPPPGRGLRLGTSFSWVGLCTSQMLLGVDSAQIHRYSVPSNFALQSSTCLNSGVARWWVPDQDVRAEMLRVPPGFRPELSSLPSLSCHGRHWSPPPHGDGSAVRWGRMPLEQSPSTTGPRWTCSMRGNSPSVCSASETSVVFVMGAQPSSWISTLLPGDQIWPFTCVCQ